MMQNVMMMAFKHAASLSETIELLEAFKLMACRASICACIERMTAMVKFILTAMLILSTLLAY
jgi:hypothetical protein